MLILEKLYTWQKMLRAPRSIKNKFLYMVMPPGWSHTGNHKTARAIRNAELESRNKSIGV